MSFLCIIFISFVRLPCSPGVTLAFVAAPTDTSEEMEMNQIEIAGEEGEEEAEVEQEENEAQEEPEYTEVICLLDNLLALLLLRISNFTFFLWFIENFKSHVLLTIYFFASFRSKTKPQKSTCARSPHCHKALPPLL